MRIFYAMNLSDELASIVIPRSFDEESKVYASFVPKVDLRLMVRQSLC